MRTEYKRSLQTLYAIPIFIVMHFWPIILLLLCARTARCYLGHAWRVGGY
jgi:hypothetical protein